MIELTGNHIDETELLGLNVNVIAYVCQFVLLVWFFGCIVTYRIGNLLLVDGMGIKSVEFWMFMVYLAGVLLRIMLPQVGNWVVLAVLVFWLVVQYFCHEHFTIFGATPEKIQGYNQCFEGSLCIVPRREDRLIPDFYHIVLHGLILLNIVLLCLVL